MVKEIIPRYPGYEDRYFEAAKTWRLPFWDWAKNPRVPKRVRCKRFNMEIGGQPVFQIENPLYQFRMPGDRKMRTYGVGSVVDFDGGAPFDVGTATTLDTFRLEKRPH
jgi:hypothetical protein